MALARWEMESLPICINRGLAAAAASLCLAGKKKKGQGLKHISQETHLFKMRVHRSACLERNTCLNVVLFYPLVLRKVFRHLIQG